MRFYGYMDHVKNCSYAGLATQLGSVSSLTFTFKTSDFSGVLLYSSKKVSHCFVLCDDLFLQQFNVTIISEENQI